MPDPSLENIVWLLTLQQVTNRLASLKQSVCEFVLWGGIANVKIVFWGGKGDEIVKDFLN